MHVRRVSGLAASKGLKDEEREPDPSQRQRLWSSLQLQPRAAHRSVPAKYCSTWRPCLAVEGAPKPPQSAPSVSEPGHTPSTLCRARTGKLSTAADSTSPAGSARRILLPQGWGEAALDVRFVSAHQGRRLVSDRGKGNVTAPAWVGGGGRPGPPRRRGTQPRQRRVTDTQFREFPTIPSFYDAAETPDFDPSAAGTHLPGPVGFAESPPRPDWRRTCARWPRHCS